jgi:hypothetical protein
MSISSPFTISSKKRALRKWLKTKWFTPATYPKKSTLSVITSTNYLYPECIFRFGYNKLSGDRVFMTFLVFTDDDDDIIEETVRMYIAMCYDQKDFIDLYDTRFYLVNVPDLKQLKIPELK